MYPRGPQNLQHTLELLHVYQYELVLSKEVLYVSVGQRAAKLMIIKVFKDAFLRFYVVNHCSKEVLRLIQTYSFAGVPLWKI